MFTEHSAFNGMRFVTTAVKKDKRALHDARPDGIIYDESRDPCDDAGSPELCWSLAEMAIECKVSATLDGFDEDQKPPIR